MGFYLMVSAVYRVKMELVAATAVFAGCEQERRGEPRQYTVQL